MIRRHAGILVIAFLFAGLFTSSAFAQEGSRAQELKFGFTPVLSEPEMRAEFEPLMNYLSNSLGRKVTLYIAKDYGDLRTQMESGSVDVGSFSPFAYVDAAKGGKIRIIAQSIIEGSATYRGIIIARKDSGLKTIADLKGKRFAFVDPKSASGYVYPRAMLIEKGINPEAFFTEAIFAGSHDKVIAAVLDGRVDAGAIYDGALGVAQRSGIAIENLVRLASSDPIPHDAIAVRIGLDEALRKSIQSALIDLDKSDAGRRVIANSKKKLTGHVIAEDKLFDVVRRTAKIAEMPQAPSPPDEGFSAIVTPGEAKFTLPAPARKIFEWHLDTARPNEQEYRMHVVVENQGQQYTFGFYVWKSRVSEPGSGELSDLLKAGQKSIFMRTTSSMHMIARTPVITVTQKDRSVVITIRGKNEVARLFSGRPTEVVFEIKLPGDSLISKAVAVTYKN
jgi:phosphate/phosphite/phosphonate ABC transporter binding protein